MQINFALAFESAMLRANSAGLFVAISFAASSFLIVISMLRILLAYARVADVHDETAVVKSFLSASVLAAANFALSLIQISEPTRPY